MMNMSDETNNNHCTPHQQAPSLIMRSASFGSGAEYASTTTTSNGSGGYIIMGNHHQSNFKEQDQQHLAAAPASALASVTTTTNAASSSLNTSSGGSTTEKTTSGAPGGMFMLRRTRSSSSSGGGGGASGGAFTSATSCHEDCESSLTMRIRCRRGQLIALLQILAVFSVCMNVYLVGRLVATAAIPSVASTANTTATTTDGDTTPAAASTTTSSNVNASGKKSKSSPSSSSVARKMADTTSGGKIFPASSSFGGGAGAGTTATRKGGIGRAVGGATSSSGASISTASSAAAQRAKNNAISVTSSIRAVAEKNQQQRHGSNGSGNKRTSRHRRSKKKKRRVIKSIDPRPDSLSDDATFSACLLIKDDNEILSEWIAYHYHVIGLRTLVVAIDPLSEELPSKILQKWRLMTDLDVIEWNDEQYMPEHFMRTGSPPDQYMQKQSDFKTAMSDDDLMEISVHRYRQRVFLSQCMKTLRERGNTWVIHIDTDEYVVASKLLRQMTPEYLTIPSMEQPGSVLSLLKQAVNQTADLLSYPCISMLRVLFGSVESRFEDINRSVPAGYNATRFETLRWRYHARPHNRTAHGNPKVILDVSAIPDEYFPKHLVYSIHRPVEEFCQKNKELAFTNFRRQPIAVNHYLGSWERYNQRADKRRSRSVYEQKAFVKEGKDDGVREWLTGFVNDMSMGGKSQYVEALLGKDYMMQHNINIVDSSSSSSSHVNDESSPLSQEVVVEEVGSKGGNEDVNQDDVASSSLSTTITTSRTSSTATTSTTEDEDSTTAGEEDEETGVVDDDDDDDTSTSESGNEGQDSTTTARI